MTSYDVTSVSWDRLCSAGAGRRGKSIGGPARWQQWGRELPVEGGRELEGQTHVGSALAEVGTLGISLPAPYVPPPPKYKV